MNSREENEPIPLIISYRGKKITIALTEETSLLSIKSQIISSVEGDDDATKSINLIKIICKGKILSDDDGETLYEQFSKQQSKKRKIIRLMATGISAIEAQKQDEEFKKGSTKFRIKDDLTESGKREVEARRRLGRKMMAESSKRMNSTNSNNYGFCRTETLPMLPDQNKANEILSSLANDPGVLACMAKHKWNVGCLAEMYPEGKVGESEVCVMGLNQNKGQKISLRLRTDDLCGFRKILSIRKVLYHELAHNVHSEHDTKFFQLMRQIENECKEMDWTQGSGLSRIDKYDPMMMNPSYEGGTFILGGGGTTAISSLSSLSTRELAASAALKRWNQEEKNHHQTNDAFCGCIQEDYSKKVTSKSVTTSKLIENDIDEE